jgi:hypothetical protein
MINIVSEIKELIPPTNSGQLTSSLRLVPTARGLTTNDGCMLWNIWCTTDNHIQLEWVGNHPHT